MDEGKTDCLFIEPFVIWRKKENHYTAFSKTTKTSGHENCVWKLETNPNEAIVNLSGKSLTAEQIESSNSDLDTA